MTDTFNVHQHLKYKISTKKFKKLARNYQDIALVVLYVDVDVNVSEDTNREYPNIYKSFKDVYLLNHYFETNKKSSFVIIPKDVRIKEGLSKEMHVSVNFYNKASQN